jgi:hypothetical protein
MLCVAFTCVLLGCSQSDPFLADIDRASHPTKGTTDIAAVVSKYLPPGMSEEDAFRFLSDRGFETYRIEANAPETGISQGRPMIVGYRTDWREFISWGEKRIFIELDQNRVVKSYGFYYPRLPFVP